jgi:hypothetical protein
LIDLLLCKEDGEAAYEGIVYFIAKGKDYEPQSVKIKYRYGNRSFVVVFRPHFCY